MEDAVSVQQKEQLCYYELGNYGSNLLICLQRCLKKICIHPFSKPLIVFKTAAAGAYPSMHPVRGSTHPDLVPRGKPCVCQVDGNWNMKCKVERASVFQNAELSDVIFRYTAVRVHHAARFNTKVKLERSLKELWGDFCKQESVSEVEQTH